MTDHEAVGQEAPAQDERVSVVLGDRVCIRCGFNLHGQTIVRERHYAMLAVRCPECSTIAPLQEYPTLGPWAHRFGLVLAAAWLGCILVMAFFTWLTFFGAAEGIAGIATAPAARQIGLAFEEYRQANIEPDDTGTLYSSNSPWATYSRDPVDSFVDADWLAEQDLRRFAPATPGGVFGPAAVALTLPIALSTFFWGVLWSVVLLHRRPAGRLVATGLIVAASVAVLVLSHWGSPRDADGFGPWQSYYWGIGVQTQSFASRAFGLVPSLIGTALLFAAMIAGLLLGRKIVRGLIRLLLPPNLRGPLAVLWHVDGLPSPPTRREAWLRG
jgi:hypothetical protein